MLVFYHSRTVIKTFPHLAGKALNLQADTCRQKRGDSFTKGQKKSERRKVGRPKQQKRLRVSEKAAVVMGLCSMVIMFSVGHMMV